MKKYRKSTDHDCREIHKAAKTKVVGAISSAAIVIAAGVGIAIMIAEEQKKPKEKQNMQPVTFGAVALGAGAGLAAIIIAAETNKIAKAKYNNAVEGISHRLSQGQPVVCKKSKIPKTSFSQDIFRVNEFMVQNTISKLKVSSTLEQALSSYFAWEQLLNPDDISFDINPAKDLVGLKLPDDNLKQLKNIFITLVQESAMSFLPSLAFAEDNKDEKNNDFDWENIMKTGGDYLMKIMMAGGPNVSKTSKEDAKKAQEKYDKVNTPLEDAYIGAQGASEDELVATEAKKTQQERVKFLKYYEKQNTSGGQI
jgi:hypothetical protein